jgi:hypothetical protein
MEAEAGDLIPGVVVPVLHRTALGATAADEGEDDPTTRIAVLHMSPPPITNNKTPFHSRQFSSLRFPAHRYSNNNLASSCTTKP